MLSMDDIKYIKRLHEKEGLLFGKLCDALDIIMKLSENTWIWRTLMSYYSHPEKQLLYWNR